MKVIDKLQNFYETILPEYRQYISDCFKADENGIEELKSFLINISESYFSDIEEITLDSFIIERIFVESNSKKVLSTFLINYSGAVFSFSFVGEF